MLKRLIKDEKGSVLPMIAILTLLIILIGYMNYALVVAYSDKVAVRNALDAGLTASLASSVKEMKRGIKQDETLIEINRNWWMNCIETIVDERDEEGNIISSHTEDRSKYVTSLKAWTNTESNIKNYIYLNQSKAKIIFDDYLKENLELNGLDGKVNIVSTSYTVRYDEKRKYKVTKNIWLDRPDVIGREPSGNCDSGVPYETSHYIRGGKKLLNNPSWNEYNNEAWWMVEFRGALPTELSEVENWTYDTYETREVYFPRWVEVTATVTVEVPFIFGNIFGKDSYTRTFQAVAVKELVEVIE
ncbi:hypothetical protein DW1_2091 [Proteiniborus sp. DW1]|uniref:hypothetical protein n=1 Tax=Proteiniborus sp. DW1 TaxID=1889883 RepID=UPI00092E0D9F|nr:hypothetical protein [Proteiniborus sp. DW1]SCG83657.1 hypothetical protein DW1_2091 [Proteiniborus sp. DW1]